MNKKNTYILFVFAIHEEPDNFVYALGEEISLITMSSDIRYFYGEQSSVFTFTSHSDFHELNSLMKILLDDLGITYMFLPLDKSKFGSGFGDDVNNHLFGTKPLSVKPINITRLDKIREELDNMLEELDDDIDDLGKLIRKTYEPTVDEILDKISQSGIKSLTNEEKTILDNYSKQK